MTPDEALGFYEEDEDPEQIFARFDAGPKSVTARPTDAERTPVSDFVYTQTTGLYRELRGKALPKVSAAGPRSYALART
jgi:hypothetical protein